MATPTEEPLPPESRPPYSKARHTNCIRFYPTHICEKYVLHVFLWRLWLGRWGCHMKGDDGAVTTVWTGTFGFSCCHLKVDPVAPATVGRMTNLYEESDQLLLVGWSHQGGPTRRPLPEGKCSCQLVLLLSHENRDSINTHSWFKLNGLNQICATADWCYAIFLLARLTLPTEVFHKPSSSSCFSCLLDWKTTDEDKKERIMNI